MLNACSKAPPPTAKAAAGDPPAVTAEPALPAPSPADLVRQQATLADAVAFAKPLMKDTFNDQSAGTNILGLWAIDKLTWTDLNALPTTKPALVMKDPDEERGKRICGAGVVIEIQAERIEGLGKVHHGGILLSSGAILRFVAAGSTGELVSQSSARFCGIVTGKLDYSNSSGGTAHGIAVVGMFDLPQNKQRAAPTK